LGADGISPTHNYNHNNNSNQFFSVQTDITSSTAELASSNQQTLVIFKVSFIGHPALHRVAISKIHEGTVFWFFFSLLSEKKAKEEGHAQGQSYPGLTESSRPCRMQTD